MKRRLLPLALSSLLLAGTALFGCSWETYQKNDGHTGLRQKYEKGTRVYYEDGSYSRNMQYNQYRPEPHAVKPGMSEPAEVRGANWDEPQSSAQ